MLLKHRESILPPDDAAKDAKGTKGAEGSPKVKLVSTLPQLQQWIKEDLQAVLNHIVLLCKTYKQIVKAYNISVDQYYKLSEETQA